MSSASNPLAAESSQLPAPAVNVAISELIRDFPRDPERTGRALRIALETRPQAFIDAVAQNTGDAAEAHGYRYALVLLREASLLIPALAGAKAVGFEQALGLTRAMVEIDGNFADFMLDAANHHPDLRAASSRQRVLDLIVECGTSVNNWRALMRLHETGDDNVRAKCASVMARCPLTENGSPARFERADARERADLIEALWGEEGERGAVLLDLARSDPNNRVAGNACLALYRAGDSRALACLAEMIARPAPEFRITAAWVMGQVRDPRFIPLLRQAANSGDAALRRTAIRSLSRLERMHPTPDAEDLAELQWISKTATAEGVEHWLRAIAPGGKYASGIASIDFFVCGQEGDILDYSVERAGGAGNSMVRLVYPMDASESLLGAVARKPPAQSWMLGGYGAGPGEPADGPPEFRQDTGVLKAALKGRERIAAGPGEAARLLLPPHGIAARGSVDTSMDSLVLCLGPRRDADGAATTAELAELEGQCTARGIRLHVWNTATGDLTLGARMEFLMAAFEERYVVRPAIGKEVRAFVLRDRGRVPARFSPEARVDGVFPAESEV